MNFTNNVAWLVVFSLHSAPLLAYDRAARQAALKGERSLSTKNLSGADLRRIDLGVDKSGIRAFLYQTNFNGATLDGAILNGANAREADFIGASLQGMSAVGTDFSQAWFNEIGKESAAIVDNANFDAAIFRNAYVKGVDFSNITSAKDADFKHAAGLTSKQAKILAEKKGAINLPTFRKRQVSDIEHIQKGQDKEEAQLDGAELQGVDLSGRSLQKIQASGAFFDGAHAVGVNFEGGNAAGASFVGANLTRAKLNGFWAEGADFTNAVLWGAEVLKARLEGAIFRGANVVGVDFTTVESAGKADFTGAIGLDEASAAHLKSIGAKVDTKTGIFGRLRGGSKVRRGSMASTKPTSGKLIEVPAQEASTRPRSQSLPPFEPEKNPMPPPRTAKTPSPQRAGEASAEPRQVPEELRRERRQSVRSTRVMQPGEYAPKLKK